MELASLANAILMLQEMEFEFESFVDSVGDVPAFVNDISAMQDIIDNLKNTVDKITDGLSDEEKEQLEDSINEELFYSDEESHGKDEYIDKFLASTGSE